MDSWNKAAVALVDLVAIGIAQAPDDDERGVVRARVTVLIPEADAL
jgi:hypothetical protein